MKKILFLSLTFLFLLSADATAAKRYWVATAAAYWNNTANWSATSGGASGASVPGSSDTAYFDSGGNFNDTFDVNVNVKRMEIAASYTATIVQGNKTLTIGTGGAVLSGGTFSGGSVGIASAGIFTISGCAFTSTSATLTVTGNFTYSSGSFTHNSGTVKFNGNSGRSHSGTLTFNVLEVTCTANGTTHTFSSGTFTTKDFKITGANQLHMDGSAAIHVTGDIYQSNSYYQISTLPVVTVNGSGPQHFYGNTVSGNQFPALVVNKSADTLHLHDGVYLYDDLTVTSGVIDAGTSAVVLSGTNTVTGTFSLSRLAFNQSDGNNHIITFTSGTSVTADSTITFIYNSGSGGMLRVVGSGVIHAHRNITVTTTTNTTAYAGTPALIIVDGTGNQTISGVTAVGAGLIPSVQINKPSGTLTLSNSISVAGNWTYTAGTLSVGSSTVCFVGTKTITGSHALNHVTFTGATATMTIASGTTLTVNGDLTVTGSGSITLNTGSIDAKGNLTLTNTGTAGGGNATINICGSANQTLDGAAGVLNARLPHVVINKTGGTLSMQDYISVMGNWTRTAGDTDPGTSTVSFYTTKTISGTDTLYDIRFGSGTSTFTISNTLNVLNSLVIAGTTFAQTLNTGTINVYGDVSTTNTSTSSGGTATINFVGGNNQTFTGSGTAGEGRFPNIIINKSSGTLTLASIISVTGAWTYTTGTVSSGTSTVAFYGTFNLDGQGSSGGAVVLMAFNNITINGNTRTLTGNLNVDGNLTIASVATLNAGSNTVYVGGDWNSVGTWTYSTSTVVFDGTNHNKIKGTGTVTFYNVTVNRSYTSTPKSVKLQNPMQVNNVMILQKGRVITDATNYLAFTDNAVVTLFNDDSAYVCGPVRKTGNDPFKFPVGDTLLHDSVAYHPLDISAPSSATDRFEAQYYAVGQSLGSTLVDTLVSISDCEYWRVEKQVGSSNVSVKVYWNENSCGIDNYDDLRLAGWLSSGSKWIDLGSSNLAPGFPTGSIETGSSVNFGTQATWNIVIGQRPNFTPYATLKKKMDAGYYQCSNGKLMFRFDGEYNDPDAKLSYRIYNDQYAVTSSDQMISSGYVPDVYYGSNYYLLNVLDCNVAPYGNISNGFFILEVINEKGERWYLRFKHTTTLTPNCPDPNPTE